MTFESRNSNQPLMIKVDILFSNHFITLHLLSFLVSTFMYISRPDRPTHGISYLQNYFRIDKYPKPCSFLFSKKKRKLLVLEDLYFFDSVRIQFYIAHSSLPIIFLKSLKISQTIANALRLQRHQNV